MRHGLVFFEPRPCRIVRRFMHVWSGYFAGSTACKLLKLKDWLGGLDSNQDSQSQSLESYQLDDLPAGRNKKESRHVRLSRRLRFNLSNLIGNARRVNQTCVDYSLATTESEHVRSVQLAKNEQIPRDDSVVGFRMTMRSRNYRKFGTIKSLYCGNWNVEVWPFRFSMTRPSEFVTVLIAFCWM